MKQNQLKYFSKRSIIDFLALGLRRQPIWSSTHPSKTISKFPLVVPFHSLSLFFYTASSSSFNWLISTNSGNVFLAFRMELVIRKKQKQNIHISTFNSPPTETAAQSDSQCCLTVVEYDNEASSIPLKCKLHHRGHRDTSRVTRTATNIRTRNNSVYLSTRE